MTRPTPEGGQIGLVGLGLMGGAIAERLIGGGCAVLGYDIVPERLTAVQRLGVIPASNCAEIATRCQRMIFSLYDSSSVRAVLDQIQHHLHTGQIIIDTTTGEAHSATEIGSRLHAQGVSYLDATISGNRDQLLQKEVTVMAGGSREAFDHCQDLFQLIAIQSLHVGGWGAGAKAKLVTNLVLGLNRAALAEALVFAESLEITRAQALDILRATMAYSRIMDSKGPKMVEGDFTPQARLSQHLKDVRMIIDAGERAGLQMPLSRAHKRILEQAETAGLGPLDNSAIIQVLGPNTANP